MRSACGEQDGVQCREARVAGQANTSKHNRLKQRRVITANGWDVQREKMCDMEVCETVGADTCSPAKYRYRYQHGRD
jgi:hypothetical protein